MTENIYFLTNAHPNSWLWMTWDTTQPSLLNAFQRAWNYIPLNLQRHVLTEVIKAACICQFAFNFRGGLHITHRPPCDNSNPSSRRFVSCLCRFKTQNGVIDTKELKRVFLTYCQINVITGNVIFLRSFCSILLGISLRCDFNDSVLKISLNLL